MRKIKYIVIHCTATIQTATVDAIQKYWKEVMKWKSPGYHIIVQPDGVLKRLAQDDQICNGVAGYNAESLHVSYIGGVDKNNNPVDNRTNAQKQSLLNQVKIWKKLYPDAVVLGHRDFPGVKKACPSFSAKQEFATI